MNETTETGDNGGITSPAEAVSKAYEAIQPNAEEAKPTEDPNTPDPASETEDDDEAEAESPEEEEGERDANNLTQADKKASNDPTLLKEVIQEQDRGVEKLQAKNAELLEKAAIVDGIREGFSDPAMKIETARQLLEAAGVKPEDLIPTEAIDYSKIEPQTDEEAQILAGLKAEKARNDQLEARLAKIEQGNAVEAYITKVEADVRAAVFTQTGFKPTRDDIRAAFNDNPQQFQADPIKAVKRTHVDTLLSLKKEAKPVKEVPTMITGKGTPKDEAVTDYTKMSKSEIIRASINKAFNSA